jgi:hypothetical protein
LRGGLYRFACTNGLIISLADFGVIRVPHRGNVVAGVVEGATRDTDTTSESTSGEPVSGGGSEQAEPAGQ